MGNSGLTDLSRLKRRLAAAFTAVAGLLVAGAILYHGHHRNVLRSEAEKLLLSVEQIKVEQLLLWREDRVNSVLSILDGQPLRDTLRAFAANPAAQKPAAVLRARLAAYIKRNKYDFAALTDADGRVLLHAGGRPEEMCPQVASLIARAKASGRPELGEFYLTQGERAPHIDVLAPAPLAAGGRPLFLLLRVNPADFLYPLLQTWSARGETGEILLVARDGEELVFLNDLRHVKDAAMRLRRPLSAASLPAAIGLRGKTGVVEGVDYRGVPVLAAVGPVPGTNWAMVTKMDKAEVLKGIAALDVLLALLVLALLVAIGSVTFVLFRGQVERAEEMLARLTEQVPGVVYQYRLYPDGRSCFPYASSGMELIYEVTPQQVREDATPVFGRIHPDDLKATADVIAASARDLSVFHWEFRVVLPKQGPRWRLCDATPERLPDGGTLWYGIITDITERKLAEAALENVSKQRELALSAARLGWWRYDPVSKISSYDERYKEIFEVTGSSLPNAEILARLHPADLPGVWAKVEAALNPADPQPYSAEYRVVLPGGAVKWVEAHGLARFEGAGKERKATELVGTVADITDRKLAEEKILRLNRSLQEKNREMENFLYITTHDLRTPLVNIQGFSQNVAGYAREINELLAAGPEAAARLKQLAGEKVPEALTFVQDGSRKMEALISALLKVSRAGRVELKPEKNDLGPLLKKILDAMRFQLEKTGAEVAVDPGLPACLADPGALSQVFSNLLDNAVKYRSPERPLRVRLTGAVRAGAAVYEVADNGRGIAPRELDRLWSVFAKPVSARPQGEGIGLPMVKRMIERSGGNITVESKEGEGSVFRVELPAA